MTGGRRRAKEGRGKAAAVGLSVCACVSATGARSGPTMVDLFTHAWLALCE